MLDEPERKKPVSENVLNETLPGLKDRLAIVQRTLWHQKIPVIILIEGWNAAGITMSTKAIIESLDPRGFTLHAIDIPTEEERMRPFMWRFWVRTPLRGRIALFARGWYSRAISSEMQKVSWTKSLPACRVVLPLPGRLRWRHQWGRESSRPCSPTGATVTSVRHCSGRSAGNATHSMQFCGVRRENGQAKVILYGDRN